METLASRQRLITRLRSMGVPRAFHYLPLPSPPIGVKLGGHLARHLITKPVSDQILRLPFYNTLSIDEQKRIINAITAFIP